MKLYQTPDFELIRFHQEDVLTDSLYLFRKESGRIVMAD